MSDNNIKEMGLTDLLVAYCNAMATAMQSKNLGKKDRNVLKAAEYSGEILSRGNVVPDEEIVKKHGIKNGPGSTR